MVNCTRYVDYYSKTECETSGKYKYAPCTIYITRAGRGIMVAGWPLAQFEIIINKNLLVRMI